MSPACSQRSALIQCVMSQGPSGLITDHGTWFREMSMEHPAYTPAVERPDSLVIIAPWRRAWMRRCSRSCLTSWGAEIVGGVCRFCAFLPADPPMGSSGLSAPYLPSITWLARGIIAGLGSVATFDGEGNIRNAGISHSRTDSPLHSQKCTCATAAEYFGRYPGH
jgi:hypothetical protein